jgi:hypothetical protein
MKVATRLQNPHVPLYERFRFFNDGLPRADFGITKKHPYKSIKKNH